MPSVVDTSALIYQGLHNLLSNISVNDGGTIPVIAAYGGVASELPIYVAIEQAMQQPNSSKTGTGYNVSVLVECVVKGDDYLSLVSLSNAVLDAIYTNDEIVMDGLTAYIIGEPTITELIEDAETSIYMRKMIRLTLMVE